VRRSTTLALVVGGATAAGVSDVVAEMLDLQPEEIRHFGDDRIVCCRKPADS
jgi:hypothetical protein